MMATISPTTTKIQKLNILRIFSTEGIHPFDELEWEKRDIEITEDGGKVIFKQLQVEVPKSWSQLATKVVVSKYFYGKQNTPERETSIKQLISRVANTIAEWGLKDGYFNEAETKIFNHELTWLLVNQYGAFNSPVWFNVGLHKYDTGKEQGLWFYIKETKTTERATSYYQYPQCSACFIQPVADNMESIMELARNEAMIFKFGSGSGSDLSTLRSSRESLSGGGKASGPLSFLRVYDQVAGVVKSGGKVRRASKLNSLKAWHGDIEEFIDCKQLEEKKAHALIAQGYDSSFNGEAYGSVMYQSENLSVRASDSFMSAAMTGKDWHTQETVTGKFLEKKSASKLLNKIAYGTWFCGDPGMQFDDTINKWHTCIGTDRQHTTNPCVTGDTLVAVADGRNAVPIKDLVGTSVPVYAWNHKRNRVSVRKMWNIHKTRENVPVYKVALDDGSSFKATDDHLILLRDGTYQQVKNLKAGDSLMPFHSEIKESGFTKTKRYHFWNGNHWKPQYKFVANYFYGACTSGYQDHHKDFNALNDCHDNLQRLTSEEHNELHRKLMCGANNPAVRCFTEQWRENLRKATTGKNNPMFGRFHSVKTTDKMKLKAKIRWQNPVQHTASSIRAKNIILEKRKLGQSIHIPFAQLLILKAAKKLLENSIPVEIENWDNQKPWFKEQGLKRIPCSKVVKKYFTEKTLIEKAKLFNHKVVSIEFCGQEDVYDGTVEDCHNFGIITSNTNSIVEGYKNYSGIFVHNCAEFLWMSSSSCNLASLNLMKFKVGNEFDHEKYKAAIRLFIIAQDIIVDNSSYPTAATAENSHIFRTLGLGYANLGTLLMSYGLPYDSDEGRFLTATLTAILTGEAYYQSAKLAHLFGPFQGYADARCNGVPNPPKADNIEAMHSVIDLHLQAAEELNSHAGLSSRFTILKDTAINCWKTAKRFGIKDGFRNAQVTVLAPTGTISFMMDCDTTGIEPDIALVKYKLLAGGGSLKFANQSISKALENLDYGKDEIKNILNHVEKYDTIEDIEVDGKVVHSGLHSKHLSIFDCAFKAAKGSRFISWPAHLYMMASAQPFISGAISKTINMPHEAQVGDIREAYILAWKLGLKCVAIYRDGSKRSQPLNTSKLTDDKNLEFKAVINNTEIKVPVTEVQNVFNQLATTIATLKKESIQPLRRRLPDVRKSLTHKFSIGNHEGYCTVGLFEDGSPGELFVTMAKEGSTVAGLMDAIGILTSMSLQYGVPLETLVKKFAFTQFEPNGYTKHSEIKFAKSIIDYVFRWLEVTFNKESTRLDQDSLSISRQLDKLDQNRLTPSTPPEFSYNGNGHSNGATLTATRSSRSAISQSVVHLQLDAPSCPNCGSIMVRNGACHKCLNCGESAGCS